MRIRTNKLKAPSPVTVLLICLIWPLAAVVGATVCDTERTATPPLSEHPINIAAQKPNSARDVSSDETNVTRYVNTRYTDTKVAQ